MPCGMSKPGTAGALKGGLPAMKKTWKWIWKALLAAVALIALFYLIVLITAWI